MGGIKADNISHIHVDDETNSNESEAHNQDTNDTEKAGVVEQTVKMVQSLGELFTDKSGVPYITIDRATYPLNSSLFREFISHRFYIEKDRALKSQQLNDALTTLSGCARYGGTRHDVHIRVAKSGDGYQLDIGDDEWRVIHIDRTGWRIVEETNIRFVRPKGSLPLFKPDSRGTEDDLLALVNIDKKDLVLLVACLCESVRPDTAYPILELSGEHGSGKSASQINYRALIDPKDVSLRAGPKSVEDIFVAARNNHIVSYNNLSHLTADQQDALCSLSTGGGTASRKLYTDGDEETHNAQRPAIMNGIVTLATQADLVSRVVHFRCPQIKNRLSDAALAKRTEEKGPLALGFILNTFAQALKLLPSIEIRNAPRMMDFAELGEAVSRVMGNQPGEFIESYNASIKEAAHQSIEGTPVIEVLVKHIQERGSRTMTVGDLYNSLTDSLIHRPHAWPKTPRGLRDAIDRHTGVLRQMGIIVKDEGKSNRGRQISFTLSPSQQSQDD